MFRSSAVLAIALVGCSSGEVRYSPAENDDVEAGEDVDVSDTFVDEDAEDDPADVEVGPSADAPTMDVAEGDTLAPADTPRAEDTQVVEDQDTRDPEDTVVVEDTVVSDDAGDPSVCEMWDPDGRPVLTLTSVTFGAESTWADFTAEFQAMLVNNWLHYHVTRTWVDIGDPLPGAPKTLRIAYRLDDTPYEVSYGEVQIVSLNVPPQNLACCDWELNHAFWGVDAANGIDVTDALREHIIECELDFYCFSGNDLEGDPAHGDKKHLYLTYTLDGATRTFVCNEEGADSHFRIF